MEARLDMRRPIEDNHVTMSFKQSHNSKEREWSLKWVAVALMAMIAALCWSLAAASYAHSVLGWRTGGVDAAARGDIEVGTKGRRALADFLDNALTQIPNAGSVLSYAVTTAWWVLVLFIVLESLAALFWWKARALEKELANPRPRQRR